jgi:hypothetical protein
MTKSRGETKPRGFRLLIKPADLDTYGVALEESNGSPAAGRIVVKANAEHTRRVMPSLLDAVKASGHPKTILSSGRRTPITLKEEAGVRLGLVLLATDPIVKSRRLEEMTEGVANMTGEETYYWYSKVTGREGRRLRRSLRLFLAAE